MEGLEPDLGLVLVLLQVPFLPSWRRGVCSLDQKTHSLAAVVLSLVASQKHVHERTGVLRMGIRFVVNSPPSSPSPPSRLSIAAGEVYFL